VNPRTRAFVSNNLANNSTVLDGGSSSRRSLPKTPWIESEALEARLAAMGADEATTAFARDLRDYGIAIVDLDERWNALCDRAVAETDGYFAGGDTYRVQDAWRRQPAVRALATYPKLLALLGAVYGRRPFPFQTLNFQCGSQQAIHADTIHFHSEPAGFMCGVWVALEDIEADSGPLSYYPESHKLPVLTMRGAGVNRAEPHPDDYIHYYLGALATRLEVNNLTPRHALLKKGQALVWAANLAHGGDAIAREGATRRSLVVHYYFEDCLYYTPMISDVESGRYETRLAPDARTGWWVWPKRNGRPVGVSARMFGARLWETVSRKVLVYRQP
jgi:hypothetical protein